MRPDERVTLGNTGVQVTRLSLGCGPFGDMYDVVPDAQAVATVARAYEVGVRYFDTAPLYGVGKSERRLGLGLTELPRDEVVVSTKVGRVLQDDDGTIPPTFEYTPDAVRASLEGSFARTGLDRFDVVHVHDPDEHVGEALDGAFPTLRELQVAGAIRAVSCGTNFPATATRVIAEGIVDCVLLANRWTLLHHEALDELLPIALDRGVPVIAAGVFNSGVLADPGADPRFVNYMYRPAPPEILERVRRVAAVLVGCRWPDEITRNAADFAVDVPPDLWQELGAEGLLPPEAVPAAS